jgi:hypothetical protein
MLFLKNNKKLVLAVFVGLGAGLAYFVGDPNIAGMVQQAGNALLSLFGV